MKFIQFHYVQLRIVISKFDILQLFIHNYFLGTREGLKELGRETMISNPLLEWFLCQVMVVMKKYRSHNKDFVVKMNVC